MTRKADIAWAAGLYEGEGSVSATRTYCRDGRRKKHGHAQVHVRIQMTDRDVLKKFQAIVECGRIYGPYRHNSPFPRRKPTWLWSTTRQDEARTVLLLLQPWLCRRRSGQIQPMLRELAR